MSGRGYARGQGRGQGRGAGRGRHTPETTKLERDPKFKGSNHELPSLNYGASQKENKPIEFLQTMGEHVAIKYEPSICKAFWSTPPEYGEEDEAPVMPVDIPAGNAGKIILFEYQNDCKEWKSESKQIRDQKQQVFTLVYSQLSESSRCEVQDDEDWTTAYQDRDLLFLIGRIRATHIARQSGNPGQDRERVSTAWANLRMFPNETSFAFRKRVEDYQLERQAVGLAEIPEEELVTGLLNRLDMSRYAQLVRDYFDNERRGIAELPTTSSTLWKEVKDAQILRFRGTGNHLESVYLSRIDEINEDTARGRGRTGRGGRSGRGNRGGRHGRGQYRPPNDSKPQEEPKEAGIAREKSPNPADIICWTCHMKGHRSSACPTKKVHFAASTDGDHTIYFTAVKDFDRTRQDDTHRDHMDPINSIFLSKAQDRDSIILLDTQASIHIFHDPNIVSDVRSSDSPVTVQGITGDRVRVTMEGTIREIGLRGYYSPNMTANIISYHKLKDTHAVQYDEETDTFTAVPAGGPTLTFICMNGHYIMNIGTVAHAYVIDIGSKAVRYSARQLTGARKAYEFMQRMGYISYKAAAEIIQRGSMKNITFSRADLVVAQDIYGTPAAYQLGQGTQSSTKSREADRIPLHESVD